MECSPRRWCSRPAIAASYTAFRRNRRETARRRWSFSWRRFTMSNPSVLGGSLYRRHDREAVRHLFRVAAGLDSMMLGEAEILGQVREAYRIALDHGATGPVLNRMFQSALEVGKRVRSETEIGTRPDVGGVCRGEAGRANFRQPARGIQR